MKEKKVSSKGSAAAKKAHKTRAQIAAALYESQIGKKAAATRKLNKQNKNAR